MAYEDFTTYTEVDEGDNITVTSSKVDWINLSRDETSYVYKDFGVGTFSDVDHDIEIEQSTNTNNGMAGFWVVSNVISEMRTYWTSTPGLVFFGNYDAGNYRFFVRDGASGNEDFWHGIADTVYYCTVTRIGTTFTCKLYDDAEKTSLKATLSVICGTTLFRYLYACASYNFGVGLATGFSQKFDIPEVPRVPRVPRPTAAVGNPYMF